MPCSARSIFSLQFIVITTGTQPKLWHQAENRQFCQLEKSKRGFCPLCWNYESGAQEQFLCPKSRTAAALRPCTMCLAGATAPYGVSPLECIPPHSVLPNLAGFAVPGTACSSLVWTTDLQQSAQTYLLHANLLMLWLEEGNRRLDGKYEAPCTKTLLSCVALLWKW